MVERALEIYRSSLGETHPRFALALLHLADLYMQFGDYAKAEPSLARALEICRVTLGPSHPNYASCLDYTARLFAATGRAQEALDPLVQAASGEDGSIGQAISFTSAMGRERTCRAAQAPLHRMLSLVSQHLSGSAEAVRTAFQTVLRRKGIETESQGERRDAVLGGRYPELVPKLRELTALRLKIAGQVMEGPGPEGPQAHEEIVRKCERQKGLVEAELARQIPEMRLEQLFRTCGRRELTAGLPEGSALVEFVRFHAYDFHALPTLGEERWKPARYLAFILCAGEPNEVRMIDLGEAEPIERRLVDYRAAITGEAEGRSARDLGSTELSPDSASCDGIGSSLRAAVFDRLLPALGGRTRLFLAPDGDLTRLPFEVLPTDAGYRIIDEYTISYLGCARDLQRFGDTRSGRSTAPLVVADPDFDLVVEGTVARDQPSSTDGRHSRDLRGGRYRFSRLPGTRAEGEKIADLLKVDLWRDADALEGPLKSRCFSPRILHLATHGFFLEDQRRDPAREDDLAKDVDRPVDGTGRLSGPAPEDPMLRSGLALAGANTWLQHGSPPPRAEDGLLTAEDVTGLDLRGTELVVLSACDTGLGEVHAGEGVFGLRRAFVLAGVKTLVMRACGRCRTSRRSN